MIARLAALAPRGSRWEAAFSSSLGDEKHVPSLLLSTAARSELISLAAKTHVEDLERGCHGDSKSSSGLARSTFQEFGGIEEFPSQAIDIGLVSGERGDSSLEGLSGLHSMLSVW
jgi:hypothetical protein